jgi:hypothetical protein
VNYNTEVLTMSKIKGRCLCGKVTYESATEPSMTAVCRCIHYQKQTGSALSKVVAVAPDPLTFIGLLKPHETDGLETSQTANRDFCPGCRSPLSAAPEVMHGTIFLKAGTLDASSWLQPELNMWRETALSCVTIDADLAIFERNLPLG